MKFPAFVFQTDLDLANMDSEIIKKKGQSNEARVDNYKTHIDIFAYFNKNVNEHGVFLK